MGKTISRGLLELNIHHPDTTLKTNIFIPEITNR